MTVTIYHNPRCSKSRKTLELIRERGVEPEVVRYLETPPDAATLREIVAKLGIAPLDLVRRGEAEYGESGLAEGEVGDEAVLEALHRHPRLIERPIVVSPKGARIGRPPENVLEIL